MQPRHWLLRIDWLLIGAALGLVAIGICAIDAAIETGGRPSPYQRQLVWASIALVAMTLAAWASTRAVKTLAYAAYTACLPLLVAVYWTEPINGAQRWLRLGPLGVQPSELAKLAFVAAVARYLAAREQLNSPCVLLVPAALAALPLVLILQQPDLGTALLFVPLSFALVFCAGVRWRHLLIGWTACLAAAPVLWTGMTPAQRSRISGFLTQSDTGPRPRSEGYQLYQSKLMVALGGTSGSEAAGEIHLPYDHTDFIFSVLAGQWGLTGVTATLVLFAVLLWRGLRAATRAADPFGRLLAVGITAMFAVQGLTNLAMTVGLAPITGLTLPLVSYGGSSLVASFLAIGMLLGVQLRAQDSLADLPLGSDTVSRFV